MMSVADIMEPLGPNLMIGESTKPARSHLLSEAQREDIKYDPHNRVSLVYEDKTVIGYTTIDRLTNDKTIGENGTVVKKFETVTEHMELFHFLSAAQSARPMADR